jgi:hypothetical protein
MIQPTASVSSVSDLRETENQAEKLTREWLKGES